MADYLEEKGLPFREAHHVVGLPEGKPLLLQVVGQFRGQGIPLLRRPPHPLPPPPKPMTKGGDDLQAIPVCAMAVLQWFLLFLQLIFISSGKPYTHG
ncbi:hypothetical protein [Thermus scotoductus]|uniref:hypothetical protein n=1 Tax=Thermus scotoductus TaxID=37636 RepID=UPI003D0069D9